MSKNDIYYGTEKRDSLSFLEFGSIDLEKHKKTTWGYWQDAEAYDLYMFARYAKDLFLFRDFFKEKEKNIHVLEEYIKKSAHDKLLDYVFKYAGVVTLLNNNEFTKSVCESGSSLWGFIEEVQAMDYVFNNGILVNKISELTFLSSDISDMMLRGGRLLHPDVKVKVSNAPTVAELMEVYKEIGLFYGLSVSLRYALRESSDLVKIADNSNLTIFNRVSLSYKGNEQIIAGTGKHGYIMSIPEIKGLFDKNEITAMYTTENMQSGKDGEDTIRVSIAFSKQQDIVTEFVNNYNCLVDKLVETNDAVYTHGEWKNIQEL